MPRIGNVSFEHPIMNAAGTCKYLEGRENSLADLAKMPLSALMVGSITVNPRAGNSGNTYFSDKFLSLNSLGLPNPGAKYYQENLPKMVKVAHSAGKPIVVSIAGTNIGEYGDLAMLVYHSGADLLEVNLGCPNVWDTNKQHKIWCFDLASVKQILVKLMNNLQMRIPITVKIAPFSDPYMLKEFCRIISNFTGISAVTAVNTFPNAWTYGQLGVTLAGLSGNALQPIALGQVYQISQEFQKSGEPIKIIGAGGVATARDVIEFQKAGAEIVQVGTAFLDRGPNAILDIL